MIIYCFLPMKKSGKTNSPMRRVLRFSTKIRIHFPENVLWSRTGHGLCRAESTGKTADCRQEMDDIYALPYCRTWHPMYDAAGGIPAIAEVKFSLVSNRGCFGGCNFCALTMHQGRIVQTQKP